MEKIYTNNKEQVIMGTDGEDYSWPDQKQWADHNAEKKIPVVIFLSPDAEILLKKSEENCNRELIISFPAGGKMRFENVENIRISSEEKETKLEVMRG